MVMKKEIILALIACSLVLPLAVPVLGQADEPGLDASNVPELVTDVGDRFVIRGKGLAVNVDNDGVRKRFRASLLLKIRITDVSGHEAKFVVERGTMTVDGRAMEIQGEGSYNTRGRHIALHLDGDDVKVVLQGHGKVVRGRRLVISLGGRGSVGDDNYGFRFLCLARKEKAIAT